MREENARTRSRIVGVSLPLEVYHQLRELALTTGMKIGTLAATFIVQGVGADPSVLRPPGNPAGRRGRKAKPSWQEAYDKLVQQFGPNAPTKRDVKDMFGNIQTFDNFEKDMAEKQEMIDRTLKS